MNNSESLFPTGKPHVSFSEIKVWKECSYRHKLMYIDKVDLFEPSPFLDFGTAVHEGCETFLTTGEIDREKLLGDIRSAWEKYGFDLDYTDEYVKENAFQGRFQHLLFTRVMPNLKKIGLLPDRLLPKYEQLGVSQWIDSESDYETSWEELSKPLEEVA